MMNDEPCGFAFKDDERRTLRVRAYMNRT